MSEERTGLVIASHGRRILVETAQGERVPCAIQGRDLQIHCGDEVRWRRDTATDRGIATERLPRRSVLERTNAHGGTEVVVANLTHLIVVVAPEPVADFFIVDRFLAAAELAGIAAMIVRNKLDLPAPPDVDEELANYAAIGYPYVVASTLHNTGIEELAQRLAGQRSVLVGQSGVGKSSLANALVPGLGAATAELSSATEEGKHVTSVSTLHHLPGGGDLIDSPGVRDFAPAIERIGRAADAFREIAALAGQCRFSDCRHLREPDCAVLGAVEEGRIKQRRYESFKRLGRLREQLTPAPGPRQRQRR